VTMLGPNHWSVLFPGRFTALSTLLELRATDTLASASGSATLPVSGAVTIEAWKLAASVVDLGARITDLTTYLTSDEAAVGTYLHGNRFVAFVNVGGMEYEGGTTSSPGSLRHETFHSWFGRGAKPASQADGWWDEAWDVYNDLGASGLLPFDFTAPPVELNSRNQWVRTTPSAAYSSGERFFEGVAALVGIPNLKTHMSAFYKEHTARPATTADLETLLVRRSGEPTIVDACHRFVYGFPDPSPAPDLWIHDDPGDPGGNLWAGRFWDSPDLWIRNADDGGTTHQPVEHGQDNWFYARVRNRSVQAAARHFVVTFNVKPFLGTEFVYPADFIPCIAAVAGFELGPGASAIVKARWPASLVPPAGTHACWLAAVLTRGDPPSTGLHVWEHNNLAQKNLVVVDLLPDAWIILPLVLNRFALRRALRLELVRPAGAEQLAASLLQTVARASASGARPALREPVPADLAALDGGLDCAGAVPEQADAPPISAAARIAAHFEHAAEVRFRAGRVAEVPLPRTLRGQLVAGIRLRVPRNARPGTTLPLDLVERDDDGRVVGGVAIQIRVKGRT
jgi:hypothetical protein